ncbi:MAG: hypothetical protein IH897_07545, partial [Planctomycetes bacterium]|nr:hypothetical protein [Planctomycetota bacterium]
MLHTTAHSYLLFFTNRGLVHRIKAHELPRKDRTAKGVLAQSVMPLQPDEVIEAVVDMRDYETAKYLVIATKKGQIKKTKFSEYDSRQNQLIAISLRDGDEVVAVHTTSGDNELLLFTQKGMGIRFKESDTRPMGRDTQGVRGIRLREGDEVVSGASDENSFTAAAKSLLTRVKTLLASSGRPVVSLPIDAGVTSELTELFVRMAEQWATITDDQKDAFDAICVAIQRDPCEMRRLVWKQRFHRILATELCDQDTRQDSRCQLCGAEVSTPSVCPKAPQAVDMWRPRPEGVIWIHGENDRPYTAIATIAGELTPPAQTPIYRKGQSGIVDFMGICREMAKQIRLMGGEIRLGATVTGIAESPDQVRIQTCKDTLQTDRLVVCAGLMADRLAAMQDLA